MSGGPFGTSGGFTSAVAARNVSIFHGITPRSRSPRRMRTSAAIVVFCADGCSRVRKYVSVYPETTADSPRRSQDPARSIFSGARFVMGK